MVPIKVSETRKNSLAPCCLDLDKNKQKGNKTRKSYSNKKKVKTQNKKKKKKKKKKEGGKERPLESARCAALLLSLPAMSIDWPRPKVYRPAAAAADDKPSAVTSPLFIYIYTCKHVYLQYLHSIFLPSHALIN